MSRWKKFFIALAVIASIYIVRATGLDGGLIDNAFTALIDAITSDQVEETRDQDSVKDIVVPK